MKQKEFNYKIVGEKSLKSWDGKTYDYYIEKSETFGKSHPSLAEFVKKNHYLKTIPRGNKVIYSLYYLGELCGVAAFSYPTGVKVISKYGQVLELKRFVLRNDLPKNSESFFLSICLNDIKKTYTKVKLKGVISYADPSKGHEGTIYKAANFNFIGKQSSQTMGLVFKGEIFRSNLLYQDTKTGYKLRRLKEQGRAKFVTMPKKNIYLYNFGGK